MTPASGAPAFRKRSPSDPDALLVEAAGLRWLADAQGRGGARVARVVGEGPGWLDLERIRATSPTRAAARAFGRALAHTHAAGAPAFGCPPPGWSGTGRIGLAPLPLHDGAESARAPQAGSAAGTAPATAAQSWGRFYAEHRVLPYLRAGVDGGTVSRADARVIERVAARAGDGAFDADQPALVNVPVARIHGDLWSGNVLWDAAAGGEAVLIDPAAHGGHAETDLAMLDLFGQPMLADITAAYEEASALAPGWRERVALHQLHPLLVHAVLFGGGYGRRAGAAAARC